MKHRIGFNTLGRRSAHRKSMLRNMLISFFRHERITTTKAKALEVRRLAEKMVTRAKADSVHNRRIIGRRVHDEAVLSKLFKEIGPRFVDRPGGYTRVLKLGRRFGDASEMVILELVDRKAKEKKKTKKVEKGGKAEKTDKADKPAKAEA